MYYNKDLHTIQNGQNIILECKVHKWPSRTCFDDKSNSHICIEFPTIEQSELSGPFIIESFDNLGMIWKKTQINVWKELPFQTKNTIKLYKLEHWTEEHIIY